MQLLIRISSIIVFASLLNFNLSAQTADQFDMPETAERVMYKKIDAVSLHAWVFKPSDWKAEDERPAIVFFFGGGWASGNPKQFEEHCKYLAARGMVAISAEYRVKNRHGVPAWKCIADAKSAIRWVRQHAAQLGIDPERIAAGGGSAGGHLAAATATLDQYDEMNELRSISSKANALVLFNPALVLAPVPDFFDPAEANLKNLAARFEVPLETVSPFHNINTGTAPSIIFHGTADTTVPFRTIELFAGQMRQKGNRCDLFAYRNMEHAFFNYGRTKNGPFVDTVQKMDAFLVSLGYLDPLPEVKMVD